jgi:hypothetical protein
MHPVKKLLLYTLFCCVTCLLYACPFSSSYSLDEESANLVDESLVGKWATMVSGSTGKEYPLKMILEKKTDTLYNICLISDFSELKRYTRISGDSLTGTAFINVASDRLFMSIQMLGLQYLAEVKLKDGKLNLLPLCEHFTNKIVKSNAELHKAIELHYITRLRPFYDEAFCLKDMVRVN